MFRFTGKPSSGSHNQYLLKITYLVKSRYVDAVQDVVSVMAAYCHNNHNTDNVLYGLYISTFNQVCNF